MGDSLGAAARVGFELLARHDRPIFESDLLILAAVPDTDPSRLAPVGGIPNKHEAAQRSGRIRRVLLAKATPPHARPSPGAGRLESLYADTVEEAVKHASGIVTCLRDYLQRVVAMPDEVGRTLPYAGGRLLTKLNVPMEVLRYEPRFEREFRREDDEDGRAAHGRPSERGSGGTDLDWGEWPYQVPRRDVEQQLPWSKVRRKSAPTEATVEVIIGASGLGKSQLTRMTVHDMADEGLTRLGQPGTTVDELDLPVLLQCQTLAKMVREGRELANTIADVVAGTTAGSGPAGAPAFDYVRRRLTASLNDADRPTRGRVWLIPDAYDQVGSEYVPTMATRLEQLAKWRLCRVILTARPAAYNRRAWERDRDRTTAGPQCFAPSSISWRRSARLKRARSSTGGSLEGARSGRR
jgi:hypothetical protein